MPKYRKKPVVVEAVLWNGTKLDAPAPAWIGEALNKIPGEVGWITRSQNCLLIVTLEGDMRCYPGDYIIRGVKGELYPCKPDIFALTYEVAGDTAKHDGCMEEQARAWWAVCGALDKAYPGWTGLTDTGMASAVLAIEHLKAASVPLSELLAKVGTSIAGTKKDSPNG